MRVAVVGAAGYAGGELLRLLLRHPEVERCVATSRSQAGRPIAEVHPGVGALSQDRFSAATAGEAAREADVVFLALEHGQSSRQAEEVFAADPRLIVDLAADFRVSDPALYERYYGAHPTPALLERFLYGLADVEGGRLRGARAIASPGCFATAAALALYPLARVGREEMRPTLFGVTGSSGAGVQPKPTTHHPARANNVFAYGVLGHRHEAEVLHLWRGWTGRPDAAARLMTHSGPFVRGIYVTAHAYVGEGDVEGSRAQHAAPLRAGSAGGAIMDVYRDAYAGRPFVRVLEQAPELTHAVGTNMALIHAAQSDDGREIQVMVAIDNLIKGAGGQAIQAMNLALGLPETAGVDVTGMYPC